MPVGELLSRTSASELTDWFVYEEMTGPFGGARTDLHAGVIASTIANVNRKKGKKAYRPRDFIPEWDRPRAQSPNAMSSLLKSLTLGFGGKIVRKNRED